MRVVDLTHELPANTIVTLDNLDFHSNTSKKILTTHIEAPAYLEPEGKRLDQIEPQSFITDAVLLDLSHMKPGQFIDDEDLEAAEEAAGLAVREGEVVMIHTGWGKDTESEQYWSDYPPLSRNGAEYLEFRRVGGVGIDAPSIDPAMDHSMPAHAILFQEGIFVIENLCSLNQINQERFRLIALPLKIKGPTSLVRVVAQLGF